LLLLLLLNAADDDIKMKEKNEIVSFHFINGFHFVSRPSGQPTFITCRANKKA